MVVYGHFCKTITYLHHLRCFGNNWEVILLYCRWTVEVVLNERRDPGDNASTLYDLSLIHI